MDGKVPPWNAQGRHNVEGAYNALQECQGLENTNNISAHYGEVTVNGNYRENMFPNTLWPQTLQNKGMYSGTATDSGNYLYFPINQHPVRSNTGDVGESYGERPTAEEQDLERGNSSNWTSVIKEALEMSNGLELEQDLSVDMCRPAVLYEEPDTGVLDPVKDHFHSVDYMSSSEERDKRKEVNRACDSSVAVLSDGSNQKSKQDVRPKRIIQELYSSTDSSSVTDKILKGTKCSTLEHRSLLGFHNASEVCSPEQHTDTEQPEVSDLTKKPCVSDKLHLIRFNMDEQPNMEDLHELASKVASHPSDSSGNEDGTFLTAATLLGVNAEHGSCSIVHAQSCKDVSTLKCADSQAKFSEEYFSKGDNATLPESFRITGNNLKAHIAQISKPEGDCLNLNDNIDQLDQHGCTRSEININHNNTELQNEKPAVPLSGLMPVEENWCSNITDEASISNNQHCSSISNVKNQNVNGFECVFDSNSAEPSCACSSTSVSKLEDLVHNLYKVIPLNVPHSSTEPHQIQTDSTNKVASEHEGSHLPPRQEVCLNNLSNAEYRLGKEAPFTTKTLCAIQQSEKVVKKQNKSVKRKMDDFNPNSKTTGVSCSTKQPHKMEPQEPSMSPVLTKELKHSDEAPSTMETRNTAKLSLSTPNKHDFSAIQVTKDLAHISKTVSKSLRKKKVPSSISETPESCAFENVPESSSPVISENVLSNPNQQNALKRQNTSRKRKTGYGTLTGRGQKTGEQMSVSQSMTSDSNNMQVTHKNSSVLHPKTNLQIKKQEETEYTMSSLTTDVQQRTKRKQNMPKKILPEENSKVLLTSCSSSVGSCGSPTKRLYLEEDALFGQSKKTDIQNIKQCNAVTYVKHNLISPEDNDEKQSGINCETPPDNDFPVCEDKKSVPAKRQRKKKAFRIDDMPVYNQSNSPYEHHSSPQEGSTSKMGSHRSTNIKKSSKRTKSAKKSNRKAKNTVTVNDNNLECSASHSHLQSSAIIPVTQTGIINVVTSGVIPKKPRKKRSQVKIESGQTPPNSQPGSQQEDSILPLVSETSETRITSKAEISVKAKRRSKQYCKRKVNKDTADSTEGPPSQPMDSLPVSEISLNLSARYDKQSKKRKISKQQSETTSRISLLEGNPAPCIESQRSVKCIKTRCSKDVKCVKSENNVKTPTTPREMVISEDVINPSSVSNTLKNTDSSVKKNLKELKKGSGLKAKDHSDTQTVSIQNVAHGMVNTPDLQLDFCIMKTSEELPESDPNKIADKKKAKKSRKITQNPGSVELANTVQTTYEELPVHDLNKNIAKKKAKNPKKNAQKNGPVDPYLFTETVSPVELANTVQNTYEELPVRDLNKNVTKKKAKNPRKYTKKHGPVDPYLFTETVSPVELANTIQSMPVIKNEPEMLCVTTKEVNNLKKPRQQESVPKKHYLVWKKNVKLDPEGCQEMPVTQSQVSDSLNKEMVSVNVDAPKDHSTKVDGQDDLKRIKNSLQMKKKVGRPFKKKTLIKMAKLLSAVEKPLGNTCTQGLQKARQSDVSKETINKVLIKKEETKTELPSSRKSCRLQKNISYFSENAKKCSSIMSFDLCERALEESALSHSATTMDATPTPNVLNFSGAERKRAGRGRPPKKKRKCPTLRVQEVQTGALDEFEKRTQVSSKAKNKSSKCSVTMKNDTKQKENMSMPPMECGVPSGQNIHLSQSVASEEIKSTAPARLVKQKTDRPNRKRGLLKLAVSSSLEKPFAEWNISSLSDTLNLPLTVPSHSKRRGKKSKIKSPNLQLSNLRHSKRLAKVKGFQNPDLRLANNKVLSHSQSVLQKDMKKTQKDMKKTQKSSKRKGSSNTSIIHELVPNKSMLSGTPLDRHRKTSKNKEMQLVANISSISRKRKLNSEISSSAESPSTHSKKQDQKRGTIKRQSKVVGSKRKITKRNQNIGQVAGRKILDEQLQQKTYENDKLLHLSEHPLETEMHKKVILRDDEKSSAKDFHADTSTTLKSEDEGANITVLTNSILKLKNENVKGRACRKKKTCYGKRKKEKVLSIKPKAGDTLELSQQPSASNAGFQSSKLDDACCDKKIKEQESEKLLIHANAEVSDQHEHALSVEKDVTPESSSGTKLGIDAISHHSQVQTTDGFTQYCEEDCMETPNKDTCHTANKTAKRGSLSEGIATKIITCKYCGRSFHHISAYTIHRRIHTGEKPYRCKDCGKNFAHLSKIKSHRKIHVQPVSLKCPCCTKIFSQQYDLVSHFKVHLKANQNHKSGKSKPNVPSVDKTSLVCKICGNSFPDNLMLKSHMHIHGREELLSCKACGKKFHQSLHLMAHEKMHWPVKPYACSICGKGFNQLKALKTHSQEHTGETPFSCCHCNHAFSDLSTLRAHQASKLCIGKQRLNGNHSDIEGFLVNQGVDGQVNTPIFFRCPICKQLYQKWCQYTLHLQTHTKSPPYLCFSCGQSYDKDSEVSVHCKVCCHSSGEEASCAASLSDVFHGDTQKCTYSENNTQNNCCSLQTATSKNSSQSSVMQPKNNSNADDSLPRTEQLTSQPPPAMKNSSLPETVDLPNDGQLIINSRPPSPSLSVMSCASSNDSLECIEISPSLWKFECQRCGQRYKRYRSLCAHMQSHAPGFRYVCGHCGQSFERWNRLWFHQRIHRAKSRCYSCSQCNLQFMFFTSYKYHMMSHASERPFACPLCPQTFVHEEGLHTHQCALHQTSESLQCDVCAKSYSSLRKLVKHSLLHNGAISHQCLKCNRSFTNNKILQEHLKMHNNSFGLPLPDIPSEPMSFPYACKRCKACFSTGDLLYAHQIRHHSGSKSHSTQSSESTSLLERSPHPCTESNTPPTSRSLISTLNLDAIPNDSLYTYPHPDKLYVTPSLSSIRLQIINLDSDDEVVQQTTNGHVSPNIVSRNSLPEQRVPDSTQLYTETHPTDLPQALESPEPRPIESPPSECIPALHTETIICNVQDNTIPNDLTWTDKFVQMSVFLEGPTTSVNSDKNQEQEESFECVDCSERLSSLEELHEHYVLHALGNKCLHVNEKITLTKTTGYTGMPISLG